MLNELGLGAVEAHMLSLGDKLIEQLDELGIALVGPRSRHKRAHIYVLALLPEWAAYFAESNVRVSPERDGVRISFGIFNTEADISALVQIIKARGTRDSLSS